MEKLLFELTPAQWWTWCYLIYLARQQRSTHIILPRPGEDPKVEVVYSRKHLKRLLAALKAKRYLTGIIIPRSKAKQIEIFLPASKIGDMGIPNIKNGCPDVPNQEAFGTPVSAISPLGTPMSPIEEIISATLPENSHLQAKLKNSLKTLLKLKPQKLLRDAIAKISEREAIQFTAMIRQISQKAPQGRYNQKLKLFVIIRCLQEGQAIEKPQRWMNRVASEEAKAGHFKDA
jgi:hypothetical protein